MLGWDVGYVWPLLESAVVPQSTQPVDSWQLVMGNPHEAARASNTSGETSAPQLSPEAQHNVSAVVPRTDPPPYESVASESSGFSEQDSVPTATNHQRNFTIPHNADDSRRHRTRSSAAAMTRILSGASQRVRPPTWPHKASSVFACLSCVIGVCNVSRFSMLVYVFKGCFIFQFLLLSLIIGIPFLYMQMSLGQFLGSGMLDMWYISPAFKGLAFAMLYLYILLGVYNAVPLSWLFIYFKDSFITLKDSYKWGRCHYSFARNGCLRALNTSSADFYGWSVPSYFHGRVLGRKPGEYQIGELKFEVAFNLCLVWIIIFVCLSRGSKTFGKVVYVFGMLPIALLMMVTMRMGQQWSDGILEIFSSPWKPVLFNPSAWWLAAREAFITWGLLGAVALHICSHNKTSTNITKNLIAIAVTAVIVLITSAFLFACCINVFQNRNLSFAYSSYEEESSVKVLKAGVGHQRNVTVTSLLFGVSAIPRDSFVYQSGYQVLRLATETFPAALAVEGVRSISSFWSICFYTSMILFGFGQQIVIWYCVVETIVAVNYKAFKAWHTTLTFITCNLAFLLGLPITSNMGIYIVYYLDFCVSSLWWIVLMYFIMLFAILFIRGRPYGTDQIIRVISPDPVRRMRILPFLTFMWNVVLPLSFLLLTISFLKSSSIDPTSAMGELMDNYRYWQRWAKTLNLCIQMFPLILIITVGAYQAFKVFAAESDKPFIERLKLLCCPMVPLPGTGSRHSFNSTSSVSQGSTNSAFLDDPPPKYTPPPSYSTATSRMLAKQLDIHNQNLDNTCAVDIDNLDNDSTATVNSIERILPQLPQDAPRPAVAKVSFPWSNLRCASGVHFGVLTKQSAGYDLPQKSATLVFGYHFDMAKKRILNHNEIDGQRNNSDELSEDLEYSDVDFLPDCMSSNKDSDSDCENT
ncbi:sodium- and chloride-dependent glycine transporter 1 [Trichonephila inaurata madagascariensis]|uniref:Sodium- and chloride-dependent glycine transporter 1 n=1 Tax=Trichonephila inaurata madagascariensis TaxID=2747483 RepID=A0A8X7C7T4_9ARAC|nr:sodium- and chloride-dependent glycine transporter 1 [Trichonephila inaurata madagascariensis]